MFDSPVASGVNVVHVNTAELFEVLTAASSQDASRLAGASKRLKEMLDMFGTYDALYEIASQRSVSLAVRQLAIIQFKNSAGHWRSRRLLSDEHRARIRQRALEFLDEQDDTIATCNEVIVAKIARNDYPNNWPTLVNDVMGLIDSNLAKRYNTFNDDARDTIILQRSLKLLNVLTKEFASLKMLNGVKAMGQITAQLHSVLYGYYSMLASGLSPTTLTPTTINTEKTYFDVLFAHLTYKCLLKLGIWIWARIDKVPLEEQEQNRAWLNNLFASSATQVQNLAVLRKDIILALMQQGSTNTVAQRCLNVLTRHIRSFGKFFRRLQQLSPSRFVNLPSCGDLILRYWSQVIEATSDSPALTGDSNEAVYPVRSLVQGMVLFKESLAQWTPMKRNGAPNSNSLSQQFVEDAVRVLVTNFMPLNPRDLEAWTNDPEEWVNVEENEQWEFEIRPCSERVLVQLCNQYPQYVTPLLVSTFERVASQPSQDLASVLQKEALYCAVGRCSLKLKDMIPFNQWLETTLSEESRSSNPVYPIIKRRIAWIIGKWIIEDPTTAENSRAWEVLTLLLTNRSQGTDAVVRLTAALSLKGAINSLYFKLDVFERFLPAIINEIVTLIGEADSSESKVKLSTCLTEIISSSGHKMTPLMNPVANAIPTLWTASEGDWHLRGSLVIVVWTLVEATKAESTALNSIVVPLVQEGLMPKALSHIDDDVLVLWASALKNTLSIDAINGAPGLRELFPLAVQLLARVEQAEKANDIIYSYFLFDASGFLQGYAVQLFQAYETSLKAGPVSHTMIKLLSSINLICQLAPSNYWGEPLHISGLYRYLIDTLLAQEQPNIVLGGIIQIISRIVIKDPQMFLNLMVATAPLLPDYQNTLFDQFLDRLWGQFDSMSEPRHRKLTALGAASLVSTCHREILERLPTEICNLWLDVFGEMKEAFRINDEAPDDDEDDSPLKLHWELDKAPKEYFGETEEGIPEYERRKEVYHQDPVRTEKLNIFIRQKLEIARSNMGPQQMAQYTAREPLAWKQIEAEIGPF